MTVDEYGIDQLASNSKYEKHLVKAEKSIERIVMQRKRRHTTTSREAGYLEPPATVPASSVEQAPGLTVSIEQAARGGKKQPHWQTTKQSWVVGPCFCYAG